MYLLKIDLYGTLTMCTFYGGAVCLLLCCCMPFLLMLIDRTENIVMVHGLHGRWWAFTFLKFDFQSLKVENSNSFSSLPHSISSFW
jgi:hypothetical protein